jgi:hypothetical protein
MELVSAIVAGGATVSGFPDVTVTSTVMPRKSDGLAVKVPEIGKACDGSRVTATRMRLSPAISPLVGSYSTQPAPGR